MLKFTIVNMQRNFLVMPEKLVYK